MPYTMENDRPDRVRNAIWLVKPAGLDPPNGYTHVIEATRGRTVYKFGQVPADEKGNVVGPGNFRAQLTQVFENLKTAMEAVGAEFGDVVETTCYVLDRSNMSILREVSSQYLGVGPADDHAGRGEANGERCISG